MHGDLHPGNILVQGADGVSPSLEMQQQQVNVCDTLVATIAPALCPLRLVLLDAGIVAKLQASDLRNFRAVFQAVVMGQVRPTGVGLLGSWELNVLLLILCHWRKPTIAGMLWLDSSGTGVGIDNVSSGLAA